MKNVNSFSHIPKRGVICITSRLMSVLTCGVYCCSGKLIVLSLIGFRKEEKVSNFDSVLF